MLWPSYTVSTNSLQADNTVPVDARSVVTCEVRGHGPVGVDGVRAQKPLEPRLVADLPHVPTQTIPHLLGRYWPHP